MFPGEGEHPFHQNSVGYLWRKARNAAGVDYVLHQLRHFYASGLINANCDVATVQRALGHSGTRALVTERHPEHILTSVAEHQRPDTERCGRPLPGGDVPYCGRTADGQSINTS